MKAIIVGGGIGGLATAIALRRAGIDASVYERAPELTEIGAGLSLWANGVKALHLLGVGKSLTGGSRPIYEVGTRTADGRWLNRIGLDRVHGHLGFTSVAMHRGQLLQCLLEGIDHDALHPGMRVDRIEQHDEREVVAIFSDGSTATGDILIAADGVTSTIRERLFAHAVPRYAGYSTWRGVASNVDLPADWPHHAIIRTLGCGEYLGIGELGPGRYLWYLTQNRSARATGARGRKTALLRSLGSWASPVEEVVQATPDDDILLHPVYRLRAPLTTWHSGRVMLLGDAAHPIEPALGMGAALALEDAVELASSISSDGSHVEAFRRYEARRRRRVIRLIRWSHLLALSEQLSSPPACRVRDLILRVPSQTPTLAFARRAMDFSPPAATD